MLTLLFPHTYIVLLCRIHTGTLHLNILVSLFLRHNQIKEQDVTEGRRVSVPVQRET